MKAYLYLGLAIVSEVLATSALKASEGMTQIVPSLALIIGYGFAFWSLAIAVKTIPIGIAYALWSGVGIIMITAIGWYFYNQKLNLQISIGMFMIILGSVLIVLDETILDFTS
jgi:small multidrug resistance pump